MGGPGATLFNDGDTPGIWLALRMRLFLNNNHPHCRARARVFEGQFYSERSTTAAEQTDGSSGETPALAVGIVTRLA